MASFTAASPGLAILLATSGGFDSLDVLLIGLGVALLGYFAVSAYNWFLRGAPVISGCDLARSTGRLRG